MTAAEVDAELAALRGYVATHPGCGISIARDQAPPPSVIRPLAEDGVAAASAFTLPKPRPVDLDALLAGRAA